MVENQQSSTKQAFGYGLILGIVLILFSLVMFLLDIDRESPIMYVSYLLMVIVLFLVLVNFRDKHRGGFASYGTVFGAGFKTVLFASILTSLFTYVFVTVIDPGILNEIVMNAEEEMLNNPDMTDEQIDQALGFTEKFVANPVAMTIWSFMANLIVGTIFSLIIAIFVKREGTSPA